MLEAEGKTQMILMLPERLFAFDPATGKEIWSAKGLGKLTYTSPLVTKDVIVAMSGYGGPAMAVSDEAAALDGDPGRDDGASAR